MTKESGHGVLFYTLEKILYLHPPKHDLFNQLLIESLNQPYYLVDSNKKFSQITLFSKLD